MTLKTLIKLAIKEEQNAITFYKRLIGFVESEKSKIILRNLVTFEQNHIQQLELTLKSVHLNETASDITPPEKKEISPAYQVMEIGKYSNPRDILLYAINEEDKAAKLYNKLSMAFSREPAIQLIFENLALEEAGHKKELQMMYKTYQQNGQL